MKIQTKREIVRLIHNLDKMASYVEHNADYSCLEQINKMKPKLTARHKIAEFDYYDSEKGVYVITIKGDERPIYQTMTIIDDNMSWNCWLKNVSYHARTNTYTATYKPY